MNTKCDYCNEELTYMNGYFACKQCGEYKQAINSSLTKKQILSILFNKYERLIYKIAWHYARAYDMDFDEMKSQAFLIFCEALDRFDSRAKFNTFLTWRLKTLKDYCLKEKAMLKHGDTEPKRHKELGFDDFVEEEQPEWMMKEDDTAEKLAFYQAVESLSIDGQHVVSSLIFGSFNIPKVKSVRDPGKGRIYNILKKEWGWDKGRVENVWAELKGWYELNFGLKSIIGTGGLI